MLWWHSSQQGSAPEESRHQEIMCNTFNWFTALSLCKPTVSSSYFTASSSLKPFKGFFPSSQYAYKVERKTKNNHELKRRHNFKKENAHNPIRKKSLICPLEGNSPSQARYQGTKRGAGRGWGVGTGQWQPPWAHGRLQLEWKGWNGYHQHMAFPSRIARICPLLPPPLSCGWIKESQNWYEFIWRQRATLRKALANLGEADIHSVNTQVSVSYFFKENVKSLNNNSVSHYAAS